MTAALLTHAPRTPETINGVTYRPAIESDHRATFDVAFRSLSDLVYRFGVSESNAEPTQEALDADWEYYGSIIRHLGDTAAHWWVAEREGEIIGYARSLNRDGALDLTDFWVLPSEQSSGIGRELLARAFPAGEGRHRVIIATPDMRALARYLKAGVYPRFPLYNFGRRPEPREYTTDLEIEALELSPVILEELAAIDRQILDLRRDEDHTWFIGDRQGFLYRRNGRAVGYGYAGVNSGPFALLDPADYPAVLAHAESIVAGQGQEQFTIAVPLINEAAIGYLLGQGFQMQPFHCRVMTDKPFGRFDHYINTSPMLFL